jgi:hypothetical protein
MKARPYCAGRRNPSKGIHSSVPLAKDERKGGLRRTRIMFNGDAPYLRERKIVKDAVRDKLKARLMFRGNQFMRVNGGTAKMGFTKPKVSYGF